MTPSMVYELILHSATLLSFLCGLVSEYLAYRIIKDINNEAYSICKDDSLSDDYKTWQDTWNNYGSFILYKFFALISFLITFVCLIIRFVILFWRIHNAKSNTPEAIGPSPVDQSA